MTHDEMIAVIQAAKEGKKIQAKSHIYSARTSSKWKARPPNIQFNFAHYDYRVAPEVREYTIVLAENGMPIGVGPGRPGSYVMVGDARELAGATTVRVREVIDNG